MQDEEKVGYVAGVRELHASCGGICKKEIVC
jgi:hypothetical protein